MWFAKYGSKLVKEKLNDWAKRCKRVLGGWSGNGI